MPLVRLRAPFDDPDWLFEIKYDGFRALAYVDGCCRLVSRKQRVYSSFRALGDAIHAALNGRSAVLDGEIVCVDHNGCPQFYDLLWQRGEPYFYAFDLLHLDGRDLCGLPLTERKAMLVSIVDPGSSRLLYARHIRERGIDLFDAVCNRDLEGIVAKRADGLNAPGATTWVKIKNPTYSQREGRRELFEARRGA